jgi:bacterioferritin-associated ferredoxin
VDPLDGTPTVASDALRSGRLGIGRSFRLHRARGPLCGEAYCFQCELETPAGRVLACRTPGRAPVRVDALRPLARITERWPPWFWERRFLRPAFARRAYLEALRRLSAAPRLADRAVGIPARAYREEETDVAIVGEGGNVGGIPLGIYGERVLGVLRPDGVVALRFDRLVVAAAPYPRLPPVAGNDLPGLLGLSAFERYAAVGGVPPGLRVAVWGDDDGREQARFVAARAGAQVVWASADAPRAFVGRGRLRAIEVGRLVACDVFVLAVFQPALELPLQAGARAELTSGELPILVARDVPDWVTLSGPAAATSSRVPDVPAQGDAFACLCEDVRVRDIRHAVAEGFAHPELVKRRTGALTGPCQGKLCAPLVLALLRELGASDVPTRARPLVRPMPLADLAADA